MDSMPKLSVIVPVYNTEKYLRECIDSILAQTFTDFELILVDDGSTDGSGAICDEYAGKDNRIRVIHQENGGVTVARRKGVCCACGEYITFVDSDDWLHKDMYNIMTANLVADIVICGIIKARNNGIYDVNCIIPTGTYDKESLHESVYPIMLFDYDHDRPGIHPSLCNKLIRSQIIHDVINNVDDSITYGEDALCSFPCMLDAELIDVIDQGLYYYRDNLESVSNVYNSRMFPMMISLGTEFKRLFTARNVDLHSQLAGYIARHSLECIRNNLLYPSDVTYEEKRMSVKQFLTNSLIQQSICYAVSRIQDPKTKFKLILAKHKMVTLLYLLYQSKNILSKGWQHRC